MNTLSFKITNRLSLFYLHVAVFLFGCAGVIGKALALPAIILVFGRTFFAAIALLIFLRQRILTSQLSFWALIFCGLLLAIHWLLFFQAILVSSVTIGLVGFASFPVFVTLIEPFIFNEKLTLRDLLLALSVIFGLWCLGSSHDWSGSISLGLFYGVASGLIFAVLVLANRLYTRDTLPVQLAFWQNTTAAIFLLPFVPWSFALSLPPLVWAGLCVLGVIFTALSHTLFIMSLKQLTARLAAMTTMLEPVYGIFLAAIFLNEWPSARVLLGAGIVLIATTWMTLARSVPQQNN